MITDDEAFERWTAYKELGSFRKAGEVLGIDEASVRRAVRRAVDRGLTDDYLGGPLPEGRLMGKVTVHYNEDGTVKNEWQRQHPDVVAVQEYIDELIEDMGASITPLQPIPLPEAPTRVTQLALYPVVDVHLGLYAWHKESGENYDLNIAKAEFMASTTELFNSTENAAEGLIVVLGDFFHADNNNATTERSGNHLDVDGRHDKVLHLGGELIIWMIDMALQKHNHVTVHVQRGNHDTYASKALAMALWFRYQGVGEDRVTIDRSPKDLWHFQWGQNMLSFTHGDKIKASDMPGSMAAQEPEMWGATKYRYGFSGHFHRSVTGPLADEKNGARWEILPAFTAKDEWNFSMGHNSLREIVSIVFDLTKGRRNKHSVAV